VIKPGFGMTLPKARWYTGVYCATLFNCIRAFGAAITMKMIKNSLAGSGLTTVYEISNIRSVRVFGISNTEMHGLCVGALPDGKRAKSDWQPFIAREQIGSPIKPMTHRCPLGFQWKKHAEQYHTCMRFWACSCLRLLQIGKLYLQACCMCTGLRGWADV